MARIKRKKEKKKQSLSTRSHGHGVGGCPTLAGESKAVAPAQKRKRLDQTRAAGPAGKS